MALKQRKVTSKARQKQQPLSQKRKTHPISKYRSKFEAGIAASLKQRSVQFSYESLVLDYTWEGKYKPDFILPNGIIVETKGFFPAEQRRKMLCVKAQHPDLDIRLCFQNAKEKISRAKKSLTYGQWATRNGFIWSNGTIPNDWYNP